MALVERTIVDIVDQLKRAKANEGDKWKGALLFVGAGCSVTGGVPLAREIVEEIKVDYQRPYQRALEKCKSETPCYQECMEQLSPNERYKVIEKHAKYAKRNWAHIAIAMLMKEGFVKRILTTNFDPLIIKCCALMDEFPAIYDCAVTRDYNPDNVPEKAIFYLQGMYNGFFQQHTDGQANENRFLKSVIQTEGSSRPWIVVGYSGESDPVIRIMVEQTQFNHSLYWICYKQIIPGAYVKNKLLDDEKSSFLVKKDYDADKFFVELAQELECFPPEFLTKPFTFLKRFIDPLSDLKAPIEGSTIDFLEQANNDIERAIDLVENKRSPEEEKLAKYKEMLAKGLYYEIHTILTDEEIGTNEDLKRIKGSALFQLAYSAILPEEFYEGDLDLYKLRLEEACKLYEQSSIYEPTSFMTYYNLGVLLGKLGNIEKINEEKEKRYKEAIEMNKKAISLNSDYAEAYNNWASLLIHLSYLESEQEKENVLNMAKDRCIKAESLETGSGAYNLACIYSMRNNESECKEWLEKSRHSSNFPRKKHLVNDADFNNMKNKPWFKEFVDSLDG